MADLRSDTLARVGDAAELSAFEWPLHPERFHFPTAAQWARINPARPKRTTKERRRDEARHGILEKPRLPPRWERYIGGSHHPFRRLLRADPLPGESRGRATRRVAAVRTYLGRVGSITATNNRRRRELSRRERLPHGGIEWRIVLTGYAERTGRDGQIRSPIGRQVSPWMTLPAGEVVSEAELKRLYYDTARAAVRTKPDKAPSHTTGNVTDGRHGPQDDVSTIYQGDSDEAVIFPTTVTLEYRQLR